MIGTKVLEYSVPIHQEKEDIIDRAVIANDGILEIYSNEGKVIRQIGEKVNAKFGNYALSFVDFENETTNNLVIYNDQKEITFRFTDPTSKDNDDNNNGSTTTSPAFTEEDTQTVRFYNVLTENDSCLRAPDNINGAITYGKCDESNNALWIIPSYPRHGYFRSKVNTDWCLMINSDKINLEKCTDKTIMNHGDDLLIKTDSSNSKCVEINSNSSTIDLKSCNINNTNQLWYIHPVTVSTTTTTITKTKTTTTKIKTTTTKTKTTTSPTPTPTPIKTKKVYLRSMYNYGCIYAHKTEGYRLRYTSYCDTNSDNYLWEIPENGNGIWRNVGTKYYLKLTGNKNLVTTKDKNAATVMGDIKKSSNTNTIGVIIPILFVKMSVLLKQIVI